MVWVRPLWTPLEVRTLRDATLGSDQLTVLHGDCTLPVIIIAVKILAAALGVQLC